MWLLRWRMKRMQEGTLIFLARCMPRKLRYWATIISCAEATQGKWSSTLVTELQVMTMLDRIGEPK